MTAPTLDRLREVAKTGPPESWPDAAVDFFDNWSERAAIMEYDGNMARDLAEQRAYQRAVIGFQR